jgi:5'-3' exonuclease
MGIPKFKSTLVSEFPEVLCSNPPSFFNHIFIDMNGNVHDAVRKLKKKKPTVDNETIFLKIFSYALHNVQFVFSFSGWWTFN